MASPRSLVPIVAFSLVLAACSSGTAEEAASSSSSTSTTATTTTTVPAATTLPETTTTTSGLHASAVIVAVQQELTALGFFDDAIDGVPGPKTVTAITAFQSDAGIAADGEYGSETAAALAKALQADADFVKEIQHDLAEAGLYSGKEDGVYGSGTRRAVEELQEDCDLVAEPDGQFTPLTHVCLERALS